jgi:hypothetical protein
VNVKETEEREGEKRLMGEWIWLKYFTYMYENWLMKPVENIWKGGGRGLWGVIERLNLVKAHYIHIWKCHSDIPLLKRDKEKEKNSICQDTWIILSLYNKVNLCFLEVLVGGNKLFICVLLCQEGQPIN